MAEELNPRWEYTSIILFSHGETGGDVEHLQLRHDVEEKTLNDLGEQGWEMCWIIQPRVGGNVYAYFKRAKSS